MNAKIIVPIVVVIILAGTVGGFLLMSGDSNNDDEIDETNFGSNRLTVYGNANGDDYLDTNDQKFIEKILDDIKNGGVWDAKTYPFADANVDGKITDADITEVKKLISREPMEVHYLNAKNEVKAIDYPVGNIVCVTTATFDPMTILDVKEKVVGRHEPWSWDTVRYPYYQALPAVSKNPMPNQCLDISMLSKVAENVEGGVDAVVTTPRFIPVEIEKQLEDIDDGRPNGISVIRFDFSSIDSYFSGYLTLGYLLQAEEKSHEFVAWMDDIAKYLEERTAKITDDKRVSVINLYRGGGQMSSNEGLATEWTNAAGAVSVVTKEMLGGQDHKNIEEGDVWQYGSEFQSDWLVCSDGGTGINFDHHYDKYVELFNSVGKNFKLNTSYPEKTIVYTQQIPAYLGALFLAETFYPDIFQDSLASEKLHYYIDNFLKIENFDYENTPIFTTYEDLKDKL